MKVKSLSRVRLLATPWTVAYQAPPSMGFSRQEYWSGVPLPSPVGCLVRTLKFLVLNIKIISPLFSFLQVNFYLFNSSQIYTETLKRTFLKHSTPQGQRKKKGQLQHNFESLINGKEIQERGTIHIHIGEGNGTPLQYSCLENPMDGGAW